MAMDSVATAIERMGALADSPTVSLIAQAFAAAGFELALVGGPVRDAFLGRAVNDLDFTTNALPDDILRIITPISDAQWDVGRDYGTIAARVGGETVEITTYRADSYDGETRKPAVEFGTSLEGDLVRRDFTVNAMALRIPEKVLVDPSGGMDDLLARRTTLLAHREWSRSPIDHSRCARSVVRRRSIAHDAGRAFHLSTGFHHR
jgi:poly(A) polymerase